jgi:uncharacterized protein YecE (DUF72 family)
MVNNWADKTPKDFKFTAKFPKAITHDKRLKNVDKELDQFFEAFRPLSDKILALLIQLPPSLQIHEGLQGLRELVPILDQRFRYAVEVRHASWFQDLAYNFFANHQICMVWSQLAEMKSPPVVTSDFLYVRFIGDRSIEDFGKIQIDRMVDMQQWADSIKSVQKDDRIRHAIVAANNHYAGFSPGTVNIFRTMLGLSEATWKETKDEKEQVRYPARDSNQRTLSDFLN